MRDLVVLAAHLPLRAADLELRGRQRHESHLPWRTRRRTRQREHDQHSQHHAAELSQGDETCAVGGEWRPPLFRRGWIDILPEDLPADSAPGVLLFFPWD